MALTKQELTNISGTENMLRPGRGLDNPWRAEIELHVFKRDIEGMLKMLARECQYFYERGYEFHFKGKMDGTESPLVKSDNDQNKKQ